MDEKAGGHRPPKENRHYPCFICVQSVAFNRMTPNIHRDIKDANLLVGRDDRNQLSVKLTDFGLAKSYETSGASGFTRSSGAGNSLSISWSSDFSSVVTSETACPGTPARPVRPTRWT